MSQFLVSLLLLVLLFPFSANAAGDGGPGSVLRLAMSGAFQPFSTTDANGRLTGLDADIAREIARRMGRRPVLVQTDWAGIQAGLQAGKFDLICGSMAITPKRQREMLFSLPYYVSGAQIYAKKGITSLKGLRIGVTEDSTYADFIAGHPDKFRDTRVVRYGSEAEIIAALNTGKIDAFVSDRIVGGFYVMNGARVNVVPFGPMLYQEAVGIAATPDRPRLVRDVNSALLALIQDGTYGRVYRKWVGSEPDLDVLFQNWGEYAQSLPRDDAETSVNVQKATFADNLQSMLPLLGKGAILTLVLSLLTAVVALITGALVGVGTVARSSVVRRGCLFFVWCVRGTPLLVQLFMAYFVMATLINQLVGFEMMGAFGAALLALIVNTTAYNAETLRGGINAIGRGQWDAAASLGMRRSQILRRVILPQAFRDALPSLGNNLVVLVKDTSLVGAITLIELTYAARNIVFQTGQALLPFLCAAVFYLGIISLVGLTTRQCERHLRRSGTVTGRNL
jgi:arginine/lysine/histidine/glutamine transport system substrate-binding/permease protein